MVAASIGIPLRKAVVDGFAEHLAGNSDYNGNGVAGQRTNVAFGYDFSNLHREHVYTGRTRWETPPAGMRSGRNTRNETGHFDLHVMVRVVGGDSYAAELRAEQIGGEFEDWMADRKSNELGVTGLLTLVVEGGIGDYMKVDNGAAAMRTYDVRWTSRLE